MRTANYSRMSGVSHYNCMTRIEKKNKQIVRNSNIDDTMIKEIALKLTLAL